MTTLSLKGFDQISSFIYPPYVNIISLIRLICTFYPIKVTFLTSRFSCKPQGNLGIPTISKILEGIPEAKPGFLGTDVPFPPYIYIIPYHDVSYTPSLSPGA